MEDKTATATGVDWMACVDVVAPCARLGAKKYIPNAILNALAAARNHDAGEGEECELGEEHASRMKGMGGREARPEGAGDECEDHDCDEKEEVPCTGGGGGEDVPRKNDVEEDEEEDGRHAEGRMEEREDGEDKEGGEVSGGGERRRHAQVQKRVWGSLCIKLQWKSRLKVMGDRIEDPYT